MKKILLPFAIALLVSSCVEMSTTPVDFDTVKESTTFNNRLLAKVQLSLNGKIVDTLMPLSTKTRQLGAKGPFNYTWQLIPPKDGSSSPAGINPKIDLGLQYDIKQTYTIDNEAFGSGKTVFTPRVVNLTSSILNITANANNSDRFPATRFIQPNSMTEVDPAKANLPYYYWSSNSTVTLDGFGVAAVTFSRTDTLDKKLSLDEATLYQGTGLTSPLNVK